MKNGAIMAIITVNYCILDVWSAGWGQSPTRPSKKKMLRQFSIMRELAPQAGTLLETVVSIIM